MTVTATGTLSAVTTVQIGSQVSGVIAKLYADFNSRVRRGQLLAELDPTPFQQQVEQRQADLTKARVDAANTKISVGRQRRLVAAGLAPQADLDSAKAAYEGAQAQVQQASASLAQAQTNLKYTRIVSPIDGIVVDRQYDVGQTVAAHDLCSKLRPYLKRHHMQAGVGHYGVFSGKRWENQIYPLLKNVILSSG